MNLTPRAQRPRSLDIVHKRKCQSNPATFPFTLSTLNSFNPFNLFNPFNP